MALLPWQLRTPQHWNCIAQKVKGWGCSCHWIGTGKRHTGARLAVVRCLWGQPGCWAGVEEEVAPTSSGAAYLLWQQHQEGQMMECHVAVSWTREPVPFCMYQYVSQELHHQDESSDPLGDLSSHPLPYVHACMSCISVWTFCNQLLDCKALWCPSSQACPLYPLANWTGLQPDHVDVCRWAALGLMSLNVQESQGAGEQGCWQLDQFLPVLATAPAAFHGKSETSQMQKFDHFQKVLDNFNTISADRLLQLKKRMSPG